MSWLISLIIKVSTQDQFLKWQNFIVLNGRIVFNRVNIPPFFFIHSSFNRHSSRCHVLHIVDCAVINLRSQVIFHMQILPTLDIFPGVAFQFSLFLTLFILTSTAAALACIPTSRAYLSPHIHASIHDAFSRFLNVNQSYWTQLETQCDFNLYFPNSKGA